MSNQQNQTGQGNAANPESIICPIPGGPLGDKSPEVVAWWFKNHPEEAAKRYENRKVERPVIEDVKPSELINVGSFNSITADDVVDVLKQNGTMRLSDLAEKMNADKEAIKALDGQGFDIKGAGWCKLTEGGEA